MLRKMVVYLLIFFKWPSLQRTTPRNTLCVNSSLPLCSFRVYQRGILWAVEQERLWTAGRHTSQQCAPRISQCPGHQIGKWSVSILQYNTQSSNNLLKSICLHYLSFFFPSCLPKSLYSYEMLVSTNCCWPKSSNNNIEIISRFWHWWNVWPMSGPIQ